MSWGNPRTVSEQLLSTLLKPASFAYGFAAYCNLLTYAKGYRKRHRPRVPVISIGNITCGGTGKTPITIDTAQHLITHGLKVAILSRGYKRLSSEPYVIVSDGEGNIATPASSGDEPYMIARAVPEAVVIVGSKRHISATIATTVYHSDVILLDDGFQHWPLHRDQDVVVVDYNDDPNHDALLPAGRLREPISALGRATIVVISKVPQDPDPVKLTNWQYAIKKWAPNALQTSCRFIPHSLYALGANQVQLNPVNLSGLKVIALCGIARPSSFIQILSNLGAQVVSCHAFPDHHWFKDSDMKSLALERAKYGADLIVTTEKDSARMESSMTKLLPIRVLGLKLDWLGCQTLPELLLDKLLLATSSRSVSTL